MASPHTPLTSSAPSSALVSLAQQQVELQTAQASGFPRLMVPGYQDPMVISSAGPASGVGSLVNMVLDRKDNTWLQLDVCSTWRDTRRCDSGDLCCLAHPPQGIEILESNRVVACYDDVKKGACKRKDCKFYHPPNHLKNVVHTNGRNNLRMRNELKQQIDAMYGAGSGLAAAPAPMYCGYMTYPGYTAQPGPMTYSAPPSLLPGLGAASDPGLTTEAGHHGYPASASRAKTVNTGLELGGKAASSAKYHPYITAQDRRPGHNTGAKMRLAGDFVYPGISGHVPQSFTGHVQHGLTSHVSQGLTGHVSQGLTGHVPQGLNGHVSQGLTGQVPQGLTGHVSAHVSPASDLLLRCPSAAAGAGYPGPLMSLPQLPLVYLAPPGETQAMTMTIPTVTSVREKTDNNGQEQL